MSALRAAFTWPVRVYYEDTDAGGIVYNANYLHFMERARTEWLRALGCRHGTLAEQHGLMLVVASMQIRFVTPARLDDALQVSVIIERLRRASLELDQAVTLIDGRNAAVASVRIACVDCERQRPRPFPDTLLRVLE